MEGFRFQTVEIMIIKIEAFAILKDLFGQEFLEYELPEGTTAEKMPGQMH